MGERYLVCEGGPNSLDVRVLDSLIAHHLGCAVQVIPGGGEESLNAVRSWLERRSLRAPRNGSLGGVQDVAFAVCDRNFLSCQESQARRAKFKFVWQRHEIENYLLEPRVVLSAFASLRKTVNQVWVANLPASEDDTLMLLQDLARPMLDEHAARVAYHQLQLDRRRACPAQAAPLVKPANGSDREGWFNALLAVCHQVSDGCRAIASIPPEESDRLIREGYDAVLAQVDSPEFMTEKVFLQDMDGKRMLGALALWLRNQLGATISNDDFEDELVNALAREYQPNTLFQPDEFVSIADAINKAIP